MNPVPSHMLLMWLLVSRRYRLRKYAKRKCTEYAFLLFMLLTPAHQNVEELDRDVWIRRERSMMSFRNRFCALLRYLFAMLLGQLPRDIISRHSRMGCPANTQLEVHRGFRMYTSDIRAMKESLLLEDSAH